MRAYINGLDQCTGASSPYTFARRGSPAAGERLEVGAGAGDQQHAVHRTAGDAREAIPRVGPQRSVERRAGVRLGLPGGAERLVLVRRRRRTARSPARMAASRRPRRAASRSRARSCARPASGRARRASAISRWTRSSWKRRRRMRSLALGQAGEQAIHVRGALDALERRVLAADPRLVLLVVVDGAVERVGTVGGGRRARLEHPLGGDAAAVGDLLGRRCAAEFAAQLLDGVLDLRGELLELARDAHGPAVVAEVALELAEDRGDGEGGEREAAAGVEAVDGLQQADRGDLVEVVAFGAAGRVAAGEVAGERQEAVDEGLEVGRVALAVVALKQPVYVVAARSSGSPGGAIVGAMDSPSPSDRVCHAPPCDRRRVSYRESRLWRVARGDATCNACARGP